jgi:hypothetical protein
MISEVLTPVEALTVMQRFLEKYWERGACKSEEIAILLSSLLTQDDGKCADPALYNDWYICVQDVINERKVQN